MQFRTVDEGTQQAMRIPKGLDALIEDGVIDEVLQELKSGKEAAVFVVRARDAILCAKVYKDLGTRSFQARAQYQEGRKTRGNRCGNKRIGGGDDGA